MNEKSQMLIPRKAPDDDISVQRQAHEIFATGIIAAETHLLRYRSMTIGNPVMRCIIDNLSFVRELGNVLRWHRQKRFILHDLSPDDDDASAIIITFPPSTRNRQFV